MRQINEKAKSKQQMKFIYAMRNKFKSAKKAPKKMKWVFDEEWTKGVKFKKLPSKVSESGVLNFETWVLYKESMNNKCDCTNCDCQGMCVDCKCSCCLNESKLGLIEGEKFCRKCNECGGGMCEGYVVNDGDEYYCDDECLFKNYTPEDWAEMSGEDDEDDEYQLGYEMGSNDNYWTQWDDEDEDELQYIVKNGELVEIDSIKENNNYLKENSSKYTPEYTGYLKGSLGYLIKHKSELDKKIESLETKIKAQSSMYNYVPSMNKIDMIKNWKKQLDVLTDELKEVNIDISKIKNIESDSIKENNDYKQIDNNRCDCDICECNQPLMEENEIDICNDCRVSCYNL